MITHAQERIVERPASGTTTAPWPTTTRYCRGIKPIHDRRLRPWAWGFNPARSGCETAATGIDECWMNRVILIVAG